MKKWWRHTESYPRSLPSQPFPNIKAQFQKQTPIPLVGERKREGEEGMRFHDMLCMLNIYQNTTLMTIFHTDYKYNF